MHCVGDKRLVHAMTDGVEVPRGTYGYNSSGPSISSASMYAPVNIIGTKAATGTTPHTVTSVPVDSTIIIIPGTTCSTFPFFSLFFFVSFVFLCLHVDCVCGVPVVSSTMSTLFTDLR